VRVGGLRLFGFLDGYVGGLFVAAYATALLLVVGLATLAFLATHLDHFEPWPDGSSPPPLDVVRFYVLNVPFLFLQAGPFVTVIAALFTVSRMIKHNETVAVMAAGVSAQRLLLPVIASGVLAALGMFVLREGLATTLAPQRDALLDMLEKKRLEPIYKSVWLKDLKGDVVHIRTFLPSTGEPPTAVLLGVEVTSKRRNAYILQRADRAVWTATAAGPRWVLEGGILEEVDNRKVQRTLQELEDLAFTPADVLTAIKGYSLPLELSFSEIKSLARCDPDNTAYQTLLQYNLTFPLANIVLLLVALPMMMGRERGRHQVGLASGCGLCVTYFFVDFISRALGMEGTLSPVMSSWLPVLLFGSLGIAMFESMRT
jgi:lipopolysaccharide export system permease protein